MLKIKGKIYIEFEAKVSEHDLRNVPKHIDFWPVEVPMPAPVPLAITIPINEFGELTPVYKDVFGNICVGADGITPIPVTGLSFTPSTPDVSASQLPDNNIVLNELSTATSGEVTTVAVADAGGIKGSIVVTEGPSQANVPAFIDFNVVGVSTIAPTT